MHLPPLLVERIEEARAAMLAHPRWDLPLGYRYRIYYALEPDPNSDPADPDLNVYTHPRLGHLGIATTRKVLPVWEELFPVFAGRWEESRPDYPLPYAYLELAERVIEGAVPLDEVHTFMRRAANAVRSEIAFNSDAELEAFNRCITAEMTASLTVYSCTGDAGLASIANICKPVWQQIKFETHDLDPAQVAIVAWAGTDENFDRERSREFWTWWLDEAVPQAWRAVSET